MFGKKSASKIGLLANIFLLILKGYFGLISGSLALLSDAVNSFTDILASIGIYIAIKEGEKRNDLDHPYGHHAAEPLSAFLMSILSAILAFEILRNAVEDILSQKELNITEVTIGVVILTIIVKLALYFYFKYADQKNGGQAVKAYIMDSMNDVISSSIVLIGVFGAFLGYSILDDFAAIIVALYIFRNAIDLGRQNANYLIGGSPSKEDLKKIKTKVMRNKEVKECELKAHYFGDTLHIELIIRVNKKLNISKAHEIGEKVGSQIEKIKGVSHVAIHVEPN